jgi:hypothetical protein
VGLKQPPLTEAQVLAWADAHRGRTGLWPHAKSGPIPEAPGLTWAAVNMALHGGYRGLAGGDSLSRLLGRHRAAASSRSWTPWTPAEDELVRTLPPAEVARRTGRTPGAVYQRRRILGVSDGRRRA